MEPLGDTSRPFVSQGNEIATVVSQVMQLARMRQLFFVIEQPGSSLLFDHPDIARSLSPADHKIRVSMGKLGASSAKPTILYGNWPMLPVLQARERALPKVQPGVKLARKTPSGVTGIKRALEASAAYPTLFCYTLAELQKVLHIERKMALHLMKKVMPSERVWKQVIEYVFVW